MGSFVWEMRKFQDPPSYEEPGSSLSCSTHESHSNSSARKLRPRVSSSSHDKSSSPTPSQRMLSNVTLVPSLVMKSHPPSANFRFSKLKALAFSNYVADHRLSSFFTKETHPYDAVKYYVKSGQPAHLNEQLCEFASSF